MPHAQLHLVRADGGGAGRGGVQRDRRGRDESDRRFGLHRGRDFDWSGWRDDAVARGHADRRGRRPGHHARPRVAAGAPVDVPGGSSQSSGCGRDCRGNRGQRVGIEQCRHAARNQGDGGAPGAERGQGDRHQPDGHVHGDDHLGGAADSLHDDRRAGGGRLAEPDRDHRAGAGRDVHRHGLRDHRRPAAAALLSGAGRRSRDGDDRMIRAALQAISIWAVPVMLVGIALAGIVRKVKVYDVFIEGAKEGFEVAVKIIPFLVGILVAIGMFRASGAMELLLSALRPVAAATGFPADLIPLAILRSLSGSGSWR